MFCILCSDLPELATQRMPIGIRAVLKITNAELCLLLLKIQKFSCGTFERNRKVTSPAIHAVERRQEKRKAQGLTPWSYKPQITNCIQ